MFFQLDISKAHTELTMLLFQKSISAGFSVRLEDYKICADNSLELENLLKHFKFYKVTDKLFKNSNLCVYFCTYKNLIEIVSTSLQIHYKFFHHLKSELKFYNAYIEHYNTNTALLLDYDNYQFWEVYDDVHRAVLSYSASIKKFVNADGERIFIESLNLLLIFSNLDCGCRINFVIC